MVKKAKAEPIDLLNSTSDIIKELQAQVDMAVPDMGFEPNEKVLPTGIRILDAYAGGGIAQTSMMQVVSKTGVGKTTLLIQILGYIQKQSDPICVFVDSEQGVTKKRLHQLGVDTKDMLFITQGVTVEKLFHTIDEIIKFKAERKLKRPVIMIWDSITTTPCEKELLAEDPKEVIGFKAKVLAMRFTKYLALMSKHDITLMTVNQLRDDIQMGVMPKQGAVKWLPQGETIPGGKAVVYNSTQLLYMKHAGDLQPESYGFNGSKVMCKFIKNRLFVPNIQFNIIIDFATGYSDFWTAYEFLKENKWIASGGWNKFKHDSCSEEEAKISWRTKDVKKWYDDYHAGKTETTREGKVIPIDSAKAFAETFDRLVKSAIQIFIVEKYEGCVIPTNEEQDVAIAGPSAVDAKEMGSDNKEDMENLEAIVQPQTEELDEMFLGED